MKESTYLLVADGACRQNPGPGGYGVIVVTPTEQVFEFGAHEPKTTNNRMELMGFYRGLQEIFKLVRTKPGGKLIHFISDSKYVLEGASKSLRNWSRRDWKTQAGTDVKNRDIWEKILKGLDEFAHLHFKIEYEHVLGHQGNEANERVDEIAVKFSHEEPIELFRGELKDYPVNLQSGAAFKSVYLSYVDGVLERHSTWDSCQRATTGKKGAKFKKVVNRIQEQATLKEWGL